MRQFTMCLLSDELLDAEAKEGPGRGNAVGGQREQTVKIPSKGMLEERQRTNDMLSATGLTSQEFEDLFVVLSTEDVARPDLPRLQHPRNLDGPNHLTDAANAHRCDTDGCHTAPSHPPRSLPREGTLLKLKIQSRARHPRCRPRRRRRPHPRPRPRPPPPRCAWRPLTPAASAPWPPPRAPSARCSTFARLILTYPHPHCSSFASPHPSSPYLLPLHSLVCCATLTCATCLCSTGTATCELAGVWERTR